MNIACGPHLELHGGELVEHVVHGVADDVPRHLVVGLRGGLDGVARHVVERDDVLEHAHGLVERTEAVVRRVAAARGKQIMTCSAVFCSRTSKVTRN